MLADVISIDRGRKTDRRTELEETVMEVRAAGLDMADQGNRIRLSLICGNWQAAMESACRLVYLSTGYINYEGGNHEPAA